MNGLINCSLSRYRTILFGVSLVLLVFLSFLHTYLFSILCRTATLALVDKPFVVPSLVFALFRDCMDFVDKVESLIKRDHSSDFMRFHFLFLPVPGAAETMKKADTGR